MKLKFKHQKFQAEAAKAVCDVFAGQPKLDSKYIIDKGITKDKEQYYSDQFYATGFNNSRIVISDSTIIKNIREVQKRNLIEPSERIEGRYNLTIEMETGVGKTYTYIKTMYELNKLYGWSKYIIVVPSIAIREGVYKSFEITKEHFAEDYNKKIRYFIYNSKNLSLIDQFASNNGINVMIINVQAFNASGKDARRISMKLDSFRSRRPIDVIAATNPIVIIDEPQKVEGKKTKEKLKSFNPLMTMRYSATHKKDSIYNLVYRLDAIEAYNKKLVKKIAVKGISVKGTTATESYLYLDKINLSVNNNPTATIEYEIKRANSVKRITRIFREGDNLYELSGGLEEYKGYTISQINGSYNSVEFTNGGKIFSGDVYGDQNEDYIRRIQIRETIKSHLEREQELYHKGIKVLSLFFIDKVSKYKQYDSGKEMNGIYGEIFEEEYENAVEELKNDNEDFEYLKHIEKFPVAETHKGYFSIDKMKNRFIDGKISKKENTSDDVDAFDLIMRNKEKLLDINEPVRFIFSHSALREGWDNPNVFQICTLKRSKSEINKRQEVGRGLRLCVNKFGDRMDSNSLGPDVHNINTLTVIANESYQEFVDSLQREIAEIISDRPREVTHTLFENKMIKDNNGVNEINIDHKTAVKINNDFIRNGYIDDNLRLTDKYYEDARSNILKVAEELQPYTVDIINILDTVYNPNLVKPEDARGNNIELKMNESKFKMKEFKELWNRINSKSAYVVNFDTNELIKNSINALNKELKISRIITTVEEGIMNEIESKETLERGEAFKKSVGSDFQTDTEINSSVKYDLIGKIVEETNLTRNTVCEILIGVDEKTFDIFHLNPEEFILKASNIINEQKATLIIKHITYNRLDDTYSENLFTESNLKGRLGVNAIKTEKHLYNHLIFDSKTERKFAEEIDKKEEIAVYVKLPRDFYINTPVGKYNPDWAIAFNEGDVKHIYFVAETKGDMSSMQLKKAENLKIHCAKEHFKKISSDTVKYEVVDSYDKLLNEAMK